MGILRCKMCGAPIEVTENNHLVTCSYCGSKQTIIDANDERKTNLFNRANQLRMNCDFDSAIAAYESIISLYPQEPEAYWGLALSKFGIEYVDDPKTKKKIPTIHRSSYEHFDRDSNYLRALEYADIVAQEQYKHEATEITNIQKSILNISKSEKPFDIFICYKESDNEGKRTRDSVIGQELHQLLTDKGYKVFFSRVTLENKLGTMYEPYIFAALNSAKIMIVIGTKKEYFNATWVKNEWSRFLSLMQGRGEKYIIPCYRDMDAYEMPEELLGFQAQDLNKLGFIQDLLRGINKLIGKEENKPATRVVHTDINIEPMLQRAEILIQDKDYTKADEVLEKILNNDPRNSDAYLLKSVIHNNKTSIDDLKNSDVEPDDANFKRAYQFADEERKAFLDSIITSIQERRNEESNSKKYNKAIELKNLKNYESAIELFTMIPNYKDSTKLAKECSNLINEEKYNRALGFLSAENYASAIALFYGLCDYKDSKLKIEEIEVIRQESAYKKAKELLDAGFFKDAKSLLSKIEKYKDSAEILNNIDNLEHEFKCEQIYKTAIIEGEIKPFHHLYKLKKSIDVLMTISDYKNATELLTLYEGYYREGLKIQEEIKAEQERKRKIRNRKIKIGSLISAALVCIITATLLATFLYFVPSANETHLINLINEGKYREAIIKYDSFDDINRNFGKMSRLNKLSYAGLALESRDYERALNYMDNANIEATVHYNADGGTISEESQVFKQYVTISPDKLGYDFKDWKLSNYKIDATNLISDIWLDASYEIITYNISYLLSGSTNHSDNPTSYTVEDEIILKDPSRTGYTFIKWVDQYNNEVIKINKGSTGDLILRSIWNEGNKHIVTLDPNGGAIEYTEIEVQYAHLYTLPIPTRSGYDFEGWYYQDDFVPTEDIWKLDFDVKLTAIWAIHYYKITYELNGGTNSTVNPTSYTLEDEIILKDPSRTGYTFIKWVDQYNNEVSKINKGSTGDITLTAKWSGNKNNLVVISEDESKGLVEIISGSGYSGETITVSATPIENCVFNGWYHDDIFISHESLFSFTMPIYSYTLVARFYTVTPVISEDGKTITYGLYPQKNVNDSTLVSALKALTTPESNGRYLYEGEYYAKFKATPYDSDTKFDNGTTIVSGATYWFKCEPINWNVLSNTNGEYYILSSVLLDAQCYYDLVIMTRTINGKKVYGNNYEYSDIRSWLNNEFYKSAFVLDDTHIQTTNVNNDASTTSSSSNSFACNNTQDKVFLPSYQDYINSSYGFSTSIYSTTTRRCKTTDWARAKGAIWSNSSDQYNGNYWTRSPGNNYSDFAQYVNTSGNLTTNYTYHTYYSVRPALSIKIA